LMSSSCACGLSTPEEGVLEMVVELVAAMATVTREEVALMAATAGWKEGVERM